MLTGVRAMYKIEPYEAKWALFVCQNNIWVLSSTHKTRHEAEMALTLLSATNNKEKF